MPNKKITELTAASDPDGTELIEGVQGGDNVKFTSSQIIITREDDRAFSETLLFDKNEIFVSTHVMTDDIDFVISSSGNLTNKTSIMVMEIIVDGIHAINFISAVGATFSYIYPSGIVSGVILEAGTYEVYIYYHNGKARVSIPGVSQQTSSITQLLAPSNFAVVPTGETVLNLSWTDVSNESSYQIERSLTGTGGWTLFSNPAANATSDSETGLTSNTTIYYRIKAVGDGVNFADSPYTSASGTTENAGDVTAPTFTFNPANGNAVWPINPPFTITADEALRKDDGTELTNNTAGIVTLKQTNSGGSNIAFSWIVDATKTIITGTPTTHYGSNQLVYLAIDGVEDVNGNEVSVQSITFTTTQFTLFNGTSNRLNFGDILSNIFNAVDTNFWLEITVNNPSLTGGHRFCSKVRTTGSLPGGFTWYSVDSDIYFYFREAANIRVIKWAGALVTGESVLVLKYDGSIDTNDGLDRCILLVDGVTAGSKTLVGVTASLPTFIRAVTAPLSVGIDLDSSGVPVGTSWYSGEAKDFIVRSAAGATVQMNIPLLFPGTDTSGNGRNGTWT